MFLVWISKVAKVSGYGYVSCSALYAITLALCFFGVNLSLFSNFMLELFILNGLIFALCMGILHKWYEY